MNPARIHLRMKRLTATAIIPTYGSPLAAGMDLYADLGKSPCQIIAPGDRALIRTGIAMALPEHLALLICPRSGLSAKSGITVHNGPGVIDADYRGDIGVILHNTTHQQFVVNAGDRIAQGVIVPALRAEFDEVEELDETTRGDGGFGSAGVAAGGIIDSTRFTPLLVGERADYGLSFRELSARALSQDAYDRRLSPVKWLDAEPEEVAAAQVRAFA